MTNDEQRKAIEELPMWDKIWEKIEGWDTSKKKDKLFINDCQNEVARLIDNILLSETHKENITIDDGFIPVVVALRDWIDTNYPENIFTGGPTSDNGTYFIARLRKLIKELESKFNTNTYVYIVKENKIYKALIQHIELIESDKDDEDYGNNFINIKNLCFYYELQIGSSYTNNEETLYRREDELYEEVLDIPIYE